MKNIENIENKKVVVGLSGGVDSSVAAYLLKKQGYDVYGVTMQMWRDNNQDGLCGSELAAQDAGKVAEAIGIPFTVINFEELFQKKVVDYFLDEYLQGRTPNPCNVCNRFVKWEALWDYCEQIGADYIATGHYARVTQLENGRYTVQNSITSKKDQTYALYNLTQEQLSKTLMPVGSYSKDEIRQIAKEADIPVADKPDSQDICFIPDQDYAKFIKEHTDAPIKPGNFVDIDGNVIGQHKGIIHYTVGQRKGLNLSMGYPVFVVKIKHETNEVVIGKNEDVFCNKLYANKVNFMAVGNLDTPKQLMAKIRYNHSGTMCTIRQVDNDLVECEFEQPVRAVTPGQAVVLYDKDCVALGATIIS